jgi:hypothetical protein
MWACGSGSTCPAGAPPTCGSAAAPRTPSPPGRPRWGAVGGHRRPPGAPSVADPFNGRRARCVARSMRPHAYGPCRPAAAPTAARASCIAPKVLALGYSVGRVEEMPRGGGGGGGARKLLERRLVRIYTPGTAVDGLLAVRGGCLTVGMCCVGGCVSVSMYCALSCNGEGLAPHPTTHTLTHTHTQTHTSPLPTPPTPTQDDLGQDARPFVSVVEAETSSGGAEFGCCVVDVAAGQVRLISLSSADAPLGKRTLGEQPLWFPSAQPHA